MNKYDMKPVIVNSPQEAMNFTDIYRCRMMPPNKSGRPLYRELPAAMYSLKKFF
jgi:hypothetical protein